MQEIKECECQTSTSVEFYTFHNVPLCGLTSLNNRVYTPDCLKAACDKGLYNNAPVFLDHEPSVQNKIGFVVSARYCEKTQSVVGTIKIIAQHPMASIIKWSFEKRPDWLGFSHVVDAEVEEQSGKLIVKRILSVYSVDLTPIPATTNSLQILKSIEESKMRLSEKIKRLAKSEKNPKISRMYKKLNKLLKESSLDTVIPDDATEKDAVNQFLDNIINEYLLGNEDLDKTLGEIKKYLVTISGDLTLEELEEEDGIADDQAKDKVEDVEENLEEEEHDEEDTENLNKEELEEEEEELSEEETEEEELKEEDEEEHEKEELEEEELEEDEGEDEETLEEEEELQENEDSDTKELKEYRKRFVRNHRPKPKKTKTESLAECIVRMRYIPSDKEYKIIKESVDPLAVYKLMASYRKKLKTENPRTISESKKKSEPIDEFTKMIKRFRKKKR